MQDIQAFLCPNCGAPLSSKNDKLCKFCGTAIQISNNSIGDKIFTHTDGILCPKCGTINKTKAIRCINCRERIQIACKNCGKSVYISAPSCHYCGSPIIINENLKIEESIEYAIILFERGKFAQAEKIFAMLEKEYTNFSEYYVYRLQNMSAWINVLNKDSTMKSISAKILQERQDVLNRARLQFPSETSLA